jgi:hypothetical protein
MGIVRFALRFPYTFYGLAALILFLGISAIRVMPIDIFPLTKRDTWIARIWQMLGDLDEAISTSPLEHLERRVVALEQKVRGLQ